MSLELTEVKRRILAKASLANVVGETVELQRRSGRLVGLCPFHGEKSPSFTLYEDRYYCFGCKAHGDAIEFVRLTQGISFIESLKYLAKKFGVEAPELEHSSRRMQHNNQEATLYKLMLAASQYYQSLLWQSPYGDQARAYLESRGLPEDMLRNAMIGLTPAEPFGLVRTLRQKGFSVDDMVKLSLATSSARDGRTYDFFRNRIMIPIHDTQGRVIAFGGRTLDNHPAKYMNSGATPLFDKSHVLFGLDRARRIIREKHRAIVVEGYMDAIQLWQYGFAETVACLGTAFSENHLRQLSHCTGEVILLFDGDQAGLKASLSSVSIALLVPEVRVRVAVLPPGSDPDDFVSQQGAEGLNRLLDEANDLLDFAIRRRLQETHQIAIPELLAKEFIPWLSKITDRVQQSFLLAKIAQLTGIAASSIERKLRVPEVSFGQSAHMHRKKAAQPAIKRTVQPLEPKVMELFGHLYFGRASEFDLPQVAADCRELLQIDPIYERFLVELFTVLKQDQEPHQQPLHSWQSALEPEITTLLEALQRQENAYRLDPRASGSSDLRQARVSKIFNYLRLKNLRNTVTSLKSQLARAAATPDNQHQVHEIIKIIQDLTTQARQLEQ